MMLTAMNSDLDLFLLLQDQNVLLIALILKLANGDYIFQSLENLIFLSLKAVLLFNAVSSIMINV